MVNISLLFPLQPAVLELQAFLKQVDWITIKDLYHYVLLVSKISVSLHKQRFQSWKP